MLNDIRERLTTAKAQLRRKQKLNSMLGEAQVQLKELQRRCSQFEELLARERADVAKLEGFSLTGLFYSVLGVKEERLETERQEYLAAKLKYDACVQAVGVAEHEVKKLRTELATHDNTESDYNRLIQEKQQLLTQTGSQHAAALVKLTDQRADLEADRKELQEAINAGKTAHRSLDQVRSELCVAENWGTWDMLGGGTITTWVKHSKIDSARSQAQIAQQHLRKFQEELADADQRLQISLEDIGGFSTFADYFFDGLIADWVVQSKIQNALAACDLAIKKVASALSECRRRLSVTDQNLQQIAEEHRQLIEEA